MNMRSRYSNKKHYRLQHRLLKLFPSKLAALPHYLPLHEPRLSMNYT